MRRDDDDVDDAKILHCSCKKFKKNREIVVRNKTTTTKNKKKSTKKTFLPGSSYECRYPVSSTINLRCCCKRASKQQQP